MERAAHATLLELLTLFPAVAIIGSRQCGKTTLMHMTAGKERSFFDLERQADNELIAGDPDLFLQLHQEPIAIDEAQFITEFKASFGIIVYNGRECTLLHENIIGIPAKMI